MLSKGHIKNRRSEYPALQRQEMTLTEYFATEPRGAKSEMAEYLRITPTWLSLIMKGERKASPALCIRIQEATGDLVTPHELRPDIFKK